MAIDTYKITRGETNIEVPHKHSSIIVPYKIFGPGNYVKVQKQIEDSPLNIKPSTMEGLSSLVYAAFFLDRNGKEQEFNSIKKLMKDALLWGFTVIGYVPGEGAFIQDKSEIKDGRLYMDLDNLDNLKNDPNVRFVPFGSYKTGFMTPSELSENKFVISLAGEEGAEKLAKVADNHERKKAYLGVFRSVDTPRIQVSALDSRWSIDSRLDVCGYDHGGGSGYAFGELNKLAKPAAKK
jgi:hypothetical protein